MSARRLTRNALLTAVALIIFTIEAQIPPLIPLPGVKLGLSNIVTVWALRALGPWDALSILLGRVCLGALFAGQLLTLFYSLCGGLLSWLTLLLIRRVTDDAQIWIASAFAAVAHNVGQLAAAVCVMKSAAVLVYFPFLALSGVVTGLFTGFCAQFLLARRFS